MPRYCPDCAETIALAAIVCKHCGRKFTDAEMAKLRAGSSQNTQILALLGFGVAVALLATCTMNPSNSEQLTAASGNTILSPAAVEQCRDLIKQAQDAGVIRARPQPNRINVDDATWASLDAQTKDRIMQAVSCDLWQRAMPLDIDYVVAYGHRSGRRVYMLTSAGVDRTVD